MIGSILLGFTFLVVFLIGLVLGGVIGKMAGDEARALVTVRRTLTAGAMSKSTEISGPLEALDAMRDAARVLTDKDPS